MQPTKGSDGKSSVTIVRIQKKNSSVNEGHGTSKVFVRLRVICGERSRGSKKLSQ